MSFGVLNNTSLLTAWQVPSTSLLDDLRLLPALLGIMGATLTLLALSADVFVNKKSSVTIFHGNMALADFLDSVNYPLNFIIHTLMRWWEIDMTRMLCITEVAVNQLCSSASLLSTAFMSVDRYQAVRRGGNMRPNGLAYGVVVCLSVLSYVIPSLVQLLPFILPSSVSSLKTLSAFCGMRIAYEICDALSVLLNIISLAVTVGLALSARQVLKQKLKGLETFRTSMSDSFVEEELKLYTVLVLQACVSAAPVATDFIRVAYLVIFSTEMVIGPELMFLYEFESALNAVLVFGLIPKFRVHLKVALRVRKINRITYVEPAIERESKAT